MNIIYKNILLDAKCVMENETKRVTSTREIYERDRYRCPSRPIGWRVSERVYFRDDEHRWRVMREYAEIKQRTQTNWNVSWPHARGLSSTLSRASIINQRILASGRRIRCDAHVDRAHETKINAIPGVLRTLCELPNTAFSPDTTRSIKPQVEK